MGWPSVSQLRGNAYWRAAGARDDEDLVIVVDERPLAAAPRPQTASSQRSALSSSLPSRPRMLGIVGGSE